MIVISEIKAIALFKFSFNIVLNSKQDLFLIKLNKNSHIIHCANLFISKIHMGRDQDESERKSRYCNWLK